MNDEVINIDPCWEGCCRQGYIAMNLWCSVKNKAEHSIQSDRVREVPVYGVSQEGK